MVKLHSLAELGQYFKVKQKKETPAEEKLCPICGNPLRGIAGTNVWVCDWAVMEEKEDAQVFTRCNYTECAV